jgi:NADPH:quinone reductase-like Zn-dependent oxidoreductase
MMDLLAVPTKAIAMSLFGNKKAIVFVAKASSDDLTFLSDLIVAGKLTPVIDRCYGLNEAAEAMRYLEAGHARGKVIVTLSGD